MLMPKRSYSSAAGYRYGFNGKENDNDVKGLGNQQDYGMRIYDARMGRFLSVDPIEAKYPELTPYQFASNRPVDGIDQDGLEWLGSEERLNIQSVLANSNQNSTKSVILIQQGRSSNVFFSFWRGVQDSYSDTKHSASISSLKKGWDNLLGTGKDFINMSVGKPGAAKSFTNRVVNVSKGVTNSIVEPSLFLANMYRQSPQENAYGLGYYGFQAGMWYGGDAFLADMYVNISLLRKTAEEGVVLRPYGGPGGGHHLPAKSGFIGALGYDVNKALAIPNAELARLGINHGLVTGAQMLGYKAPI